MLGSKLGSVLKDVSVWAKWRQAVRGSGSGGRSGGGGSGSGGGGSAYAVAADEEELATALELARQIAAEEEELLASITPATRDIFLGEVALESNETQVPFAIGTLPAHAFLTGHAFFAQHAHRWHAAAALTGAPDTALAQQPLAVHLTFQFGDAPTYPYGKRQRAREAGLWFADPPSYYDAPDTTLLVRPLGPLVDPDAWRRIGRTYPSEADPRRHVALADLQRTPD